MAYPELTLKGFDIKKAILLSLVLCSCSGLLAPEAPKKTIRNPECFPSHALKVFQVDDKYSLVQLYYCYETNGDTDTNRSCKSGLRKQFNDEIFAADMRQVIGEKDWKTETKKLYDGYTVALGPYCMVPDGTYTYYNTIGTKKTIRKLKMIESEIPNPEYQKWQEEQAEKDQESTNSKTDK